MTSSIHFASVDCQLGNYIALNGDDDDHNNKKKVNVRANGERFVTIRDPTMQNWKLRKSTHYDATVEQQAVDKFFNSSTIFRSNFLHS